jgi:hypothetical protein
VICQSGGWVERSLAAFGMAFVLLALATATAVATGCPDRPACKGCGCKGGPGYRGPDGRCVGFKTLNKICGNPPELKCTFENAPGTGLNHDCALAAPQAPPTD